MDADIILLPNKSITFIYDPTQSIWRCFDRTQDPYGTAVNTICQGNDSRLSDSRTPLAHDLAGALHNADSITNLNLKLNDGDVISTKAAEVSAMTTLDLANNIESVVLLAEDTNNANAKRKVTILNLKEVFFRFPEFHYNADQMRAPIASDFPVNGDNIAGLQNGTLKNSIMVRLFSATVKNGVCCDFFMPGLSPSGIPTNLNFQFQWRQEAAESGTKYVQWALYTRQITDGSAAPSWTALQTPVATTGNLKMTCRTDTNWVTTLVTIPLANFSTPLVYNRFTQIELIRYGDDATNDTAVNATNLAYLRIAFS